METMRPSFMTKRDLVPLKEQIGSQSVKEDRSIITRHLSIRPSTRVRGVRNSVLRSVLIVQPALCVAQRGKPQSDRDEFSSFSRESRVRYRAVSAQPPPFTLSDAVLIQMVSFVQSIIDACSGSDLVLGGSRLCRIAVASRFYWSRGHDSARAK